MIQRIRSSAAALKRQVADRARQHQKEISWVIAGQAMAFFGSFLGIKALTKLLGPSSYGEFAIGLTISGLVFGFIYGPMSTAALRYYSVYQQKESLYAFFRTMMQVHLIAAAGCLSLGIVASLIVYKTMDLRWALLILGGSCLGITNGNFTTAFSIHCAMRHRSLAALQQGADAWMRPLFALLLIYFFPRNGVAALAGTVIGSFVVMTFQIALLWRESSRWQGKRIVGQRWIEDMRATRDIYSYSGALVFFAIFGWINTYADRWFIQAYRGFHEVGIYTALFQIANAPMTIMMGLLGQLLFPIIYERAGDLSLPEQHQRSGKLFRWTMIATSLSLLVMILVSMAIGKPLVRFLTTPEFGSRGNILWILVLGLSLYNFANFLMVKGMYHNRVKIYIPAKIIYALSFLLIAYLVVPRWGLTGMAWTWVVTSLIFVLVSWEANTRVSVLSRKTDLL